MLRSILVALFTYVILEFILMPPLGYSMIPILGKITISTIIAISIGLIEYLYRLSIPSEDWEPWDVLAIVIITLTLTYGYIKLHIHFELIMIFCSLSLLSYVLIKVIYHFLMRESWDKFINWNQAYRNHFAMPILVAFMFVPVSITMSVLSENEVSRVQAVTSPYNQNFNRETMILEYLVVKYPDISTFDQWSEDRIIELLQDIEFTEANVAHRVPALVMLKSMKSTTFASYNFEGNLIRVNSNYIKKVSLDELINTVLHEGRHAYQFQLISQINWKNPIVKNSSHFSELNQILEDFLSYNDGTDEDFDEYYNQFIEVDARLFATEVLPVYLKILTP